MDKDRPRSEGDRASSIIILICLTVLAVGCVLGVSYLREYNFYKKGDGGKTAKSVAVRLYSLKDAELAKDYYDCFQEIKENGEREDENEDRFRYYREKFSPLKSSFVFTVSDLKGNVRFDSSKSLKENLLLDGGAYDGSFEKTYGDAPYSGDSGFYVFNDDGTTVPLRINYAVRGADREGESDKYTIAFRWIAIANSLKYAVAVVLVLALIIIVLLLSIMTINAGIKDGEVVSEGFVDKIPLDVWTLFLAAVIAVAWAVSDLTAAADVDMVVNNVVIMIACVAVALALTIYLTTLSVRVKMGKPYKNTVIYMIFRKFRRKTPRKIRRFFDETNAFGKMIFGISVYVLAEAAILCATAYFGILSDDSDPKAVFKIFLVGWGLTRLILIPIFAMIAINLHYVKEEGQKLADGVLGDEIARKLTVASVRAHAKNLDQIRKEINEAVENELKSERMKNELITNVTHDIKTPLTAIKSYVDLLRDESLDKEERKKYVGILVRNAEKLNRLMDNLIAASQINAGDVEINLEKTSLNIIVEQTVEEFAPKLSEVGLTPKTNAPFDDVFIMADGECLWRILSNLLDNACKYAASSTTLKIYLSERDGKAKLAIANELAEPIEARADELLERFVRSDRSRHAEGNGLGLSIAKRLAELLGGELTVKTTDKTFIAVLTFDSAE